MNRRLYFIAAFIFKIAAPQILTHTSLFGTSMSVTLQCETTDLNSPILFKLNTFSKGGCSAGGSCSTGVDGYQTPTRGTNTTEMVIKSCNITRDLGNWTCVYGGSTSIAVIISHCPGGAIPKTDNDNGDGKAFGILTGCLVIAYIIVIVMAAKRLSIGSTGETFEEKFFNCCGNTNSKKNWLLGFTYLVLYGVIVEVIVLLAVYYGYSKFQEELVIGVGFAIVLVLSGLCLLVVWMLKKKFFNNDASETSRSQRQQPDGHEGPQSTPKDPDARHITTTGIDTLDEQKTDKKPKDKKKKKKKMKDEEQDNPAYDTEQ